jgi:Transposase
LNEEDSEEEEEEEDNWQEGTWAEPRRWHYIDSDLEVGSNDGSEAHEGSVSELEDSDEEDNAPQIIQGPAQRPKKYHDPGTRLQALTLYEFGLPFHQIMALTNIRERTVQKLRERAIARGYDPLICKHLLIRYVKDAPKSGRPPIHESVKSIIIKVVTQNSTTRQYSTNRIAAEVCLLLGKLKAVSPRTCYRVLKAEGYNTCKQTVKPGLIEQMKKERLAWCLAHEHWELEDYKNVIWTDETSVQLSGQRGKRRVWRLLHEAYHPYYTRTRWKGFKEFMFWGAFTYDKKGPCHV